MNSLKQSTIDEIQIVTDLDSCGITKEPPAKSYFGKGEVIEFVGYQFFDMKGRIARVYAARYPNTSELFCLTFSNNHHYLLEFDSWDDWHFSDGMTPVEYEEAKEIARKTYLSNYGDGTRWGNRRYGQ